MVPSKMTHWGTGILPQKWCMNLSTYGMYPFWEKSCRERHDGVFIMHLLHDCLWKQFVKNNWCLPHAISFNIVSYRVNIVQYRFISFPYRFNMRNVHH
jgi:hypothetical protein